VRPRQEKPTTHRKAPASVGCSRSRHEQQPEFEAVMAEAQSAGARILKTIETRRRQMR
jgi:hypothetical protein